MIRQDHPSLDTSPAAADRGFLATQAEVIRSPLIISQALSLVPIAIPADYPKSAEAFVLKSLSVSPVIQTDVLKIGMRGTNADEAKAFTQALIQVYREHVQQGDQERYTSDVNVLTQREAELRRQLEELQAEYVRFRSRSPLIGQGRETLDVAGMQLSQIGRQLSDARNRRIALEDRVHVFDIAAAQGFSPEYMARVLPVTHLPPLLGPGDDRRTINRISLLADDGAVTNVLRGSSAAGGNDIGEIQQQLWQARMRAIQLSQQFGPRHVDVLATQEQIRYWEKLLVERTEVAAKEVLQELEAVKATETKIEELYTAESRRAKVIDDFLVEEAVLNGKIQRASESYARTLAQLHDYQLTDEALRHGRLLDGPELLEEVVWPQTKILLGLCGLLGMVGGVVVVSLQATTRGLSGTAGRI
jgi:uncharacterized protein involved in exopolysaccharide biosynthesis